MTNIYKNKIISIHFKYFLALILFGSNGIVAGFISLNSYEIVFFRTLIGSLFLTGIFINTKYKLNCLKNKKHLMYLIVSGMAMGTSWMFLYEAYSEVGVSLGTLAYYCGPVIVIICSPLIFNEKMTFLKIFGFVFVLMGMYIVNGNALEQNVSLWGLFCGIFSAIMYSFMVIFNKKAKSITGMENAVIQLISSFIAAALFVIINEGFPVLNIRDNIIPILFLGIVNTGIGCYLYFSSIQKLPTSTVAVCGYLEPLSALLFSAIFLKERLSAIQIFGALFILGGAVISKLSANKIMYMLLIKAKEH
ncbi:MAG: DMT family transporter [Clostridia bacterium]|nr:DMT family transporter [Clostridia bacterium]